MSKTKDIEKDLKTYKKLEALSLSEGGIVLKELCLKDIVTTIDTLALGFKQLSHIEIIAHCARLNERLNMYRIITNSKKNAELTYEALQEAIKEQEE